MADEITPEYRRRVAVALQQLGIDAQRLSARRLPLFAETTRLAPVGLGTDGRDKALAPAAAKGWLAMRAQARTDGVELLLVSGFRSLEFQAVLIRSKLQRGMKIDEIIRVNAPPGYSEHHTGRAVDIGSANCPPLEDAFDRTEAFAWLGKNARRFGFSMSYPKANLHGFAYEPWHWCHRATRPPRR